MDKLNQTISWEEVGRKDNENHLDPAAALHSVQLMKIDTYPHSPSSSPTLVFDQTKKKEHTEQKGRIHLVWNKKEMTNWEESFLRREIVGLLKRERKRRKIWVKELMKSVLGSFWYQFQTFFATENSWF